MKLTNKAAWRGSRRPAGNIRGGSQEVKPPMIGGQPLPRLQVDPDVLGACVHVVVNPKLVLEVANLS